MQLRILPKSYGKLSAREDRWEVISGHFIEEEARRGENDFTISLTLGIFAKPALEHAINNISSFFPSPLSLPINRHLSFSPFLPLSRSPRGELLSSYFRRSLWDPRTLREPTLQFGRFCAALGSGASLRGLRGTGPRPGRLSPALVALLRG